MATKQLVAQNRIPFSLDIPNETTLEAMRIAEMKETGLNEDDSPRFTNVDEATAYLDSE